MTDIFKSSIELIGLPGSGKTYNSKRFATENNCLTKKSLLMKFCVEENPAKFLTLCGRSEFLFDHCMASKIAKTMLLQSSDKVRRQAESFICSIQPDLMSLQVVDCFEILRSFYEEYGVAAYAASKDLEYVNDDGFMQRIVSLYGLRLSDMSLDCKLKRAIDLAHQCELSKRVIFFRASPEISFSRICSRKSGVPLMQRGFTSEGLRERLHKSAEFIDAFIPQLKELVDVEEVNQG